MDRSDGLIEGRDGYDGWTDQTDVCKQWRDGRRWCKLTFITAVVVFEN